MKQRLVLLWVAAVVGVSACSGGGSPESVSAPPDSSPGETTDDVVDIEVGPLPVPVEVAEESVTSVVLASSGFEIDADLVESIEQVEADLLAQATAATGPQGIRRNAQAIATSGGMSAVGLLIDLVSRLTSGAKQPYSSTFDSSTSPSSGGTLKMGAKLSGDGAGSTTTEISFEAKVETADGRTVSERISGTVAGPVCPDEAGLLTLEVSGEMEVTGGGPERSRHTFKGTVSVTFDDNGAMADTDIELNVQSDRTSADGRTAFVDVTYGYQATNLFGPGATNATAREPQVNRTSQSLKSDVQQADRDMIDNGREAAMKLVTMALAGRVSSIQNNGCVVVIAEAPGTTGAKQVVPIDVKTRHVDGGELDKRVEATLSGQGSIDPSALPKTPEQINYTAGEKGGDAGTISLVSRSRRGIGNTSLTIKVGDKFRVDNKGLTGSVCSLDAPFTLTFSADPVTGSVTFTPSGPSGGTYAGTGDVGGIGTISWSGAYTLTGRDTDSPSVDGDEGTTLLIGPITQPAPNFWAGGPDFPLIPDAAACP